MVPRFSIVIFSFLIILQCYTTVARPVPKKGIVQELVPPKLLFIRQAEGEEAELGESDEAPGSQFNDPVPEGPPISPIDSLDEENESNGEENPSPTGPQQESNGSSTSENEVIEPDSSGEGSQDASPENSESTSSESENSASEGEEESEPQEGPKEEGEEESSANTGSSEEGSEEEGSEEGTKEEGAEEEGSEEEGAEEEGTEEEGSEKEGSEGNSEENGEKGAAGEENEEKEEGDKAEANGEGEEGEGEEGEGEEGEGEEGEEGEEDREVRPNEPSQICIGIESLSHLSKDELIFPEHRMGNVLCDNNNSCATYGHIVNYKGIGMMMGRYCAEHVIGGCSRRKMLVNSPRYRRKLRVESETKDLHFTALAARYETGTEEMILSTMVRMGM